MSFAHRHLQNAQVFASQYKGDTPLAHWLKQQFVQQKKFGSKDRRFIADALFAWFRSRWFFQDDDWLKAIFLLAKEQAHWQSIYPAEWQETAEQPVAQKLALLGPLLPHPLLEHLSKKVSQQDYRTYLSSQPPMFLRLRPGKEAGVKKALLQKAIGFKEIDAQFLALPTGTDLQAVVALNKEAIVQNPSSYNSLSLLAKTDLGGRPQLNIWDACAASGGKSLALRDFFNGRKWSLIVTDLRASILQNLQKRFAQAGLSGFRSEVADLSAFNPFPNDRFELVVVDAPCSGSGTWASSPEQAAFFKPAQIDHYQQLQRKIVGNAQAAVAQAGYLLYITCSVFAQENEDNVQWILQHHPHLKLVDQHYVHEARWQTDFLFAALFTASRP